MTHYGLRAIHRTDFELLLEWRNSNRVRSMMLTDHIIPRNEHLSWFAGLSTRKDAIYRVFQMNAQPCGLVYFTDIQPDTHACTWGFYLGFPDLPKGTGTVMCRMGLTLAFDAFGLYQINSECMAYNKPSIAIHQKLGFSLSGRKIKRRPHSREQVEVLSFNISKKTWSH